MRFFLLLLACLLTRPVFALPTVPPDTRMLLPVPTRANWGQGRFLVKTDFTWQVFTPQQTPATLAADSAVAEAVERLVLPVLLPGKVGSASRRRTSPLPTAALVLQYGRPGNLLTVGEDESYTLRVTPMGVALNAPTHLGLLRGLATLRQLPDTERLRQKRAALLPEVDVADAPRFPWRGLLIDAARHFMPVGVVKRNLDGMWATKLNVLHWHLSDDQGFRVESRTLPRLSQVSGQFYSQRQVRDVIRYAARRGIRVVPEFDVPGHTIAWQAAYPELSSNDSTYTVYQSWRLANVAFDPTKETTYTLLDTLFGEMTRLFPDPYFHIGGDENDGRQWRRSARIMAFARTNGMLKADGKTLDKHALQTYFNRRVLGIVTKYGKTIVGWDEILGPGLPTNAVIQSWRGKKGVLDAVKAGNPALLSSGYYIDLNQSAAFHYATDPLPDATGLTLAQQQLVLGGEATMWAEFADSVIVDSRIWPRTAAVAERLWSAATVRDAPDMYRRLALLSPQLETLGLQHRRAPEQLLRQLAGSAAAMLPLRTLAQVLEPVKEYKRHFQGFTYTTQTPLNRLVDAAPAESDVARTFGQLVDSLLAARTAAPATLRRYLPQLRTQLQLWQNNDALVQPTLQQNPLLKEYAPLSTHLKTAATLALDRLALLEKNQPLTPAAQAAALKQLDALKVPVGQTELAVLPHLRRLVEAK
ncbi:beta-N-acetylhexosaminidase [Hymenobacter swuensis]|uniref:Putative beta-hexosaminidase n=1 Tax=Hymenobacter swuensis DY53 TaxID=1227739 RepID=W8F7T7_9BACT|nr:family 20 glycosylhydrolase [Hymenobacter swuensis]AHJ98696.1 putative beta-hexosaminidase [Hymenobacter swuensis DY53]